MPQTLHGSGDKLSAERVRIVARKIAPPRLSKERSGDHKRMETTAKDSVVCTIEAKYHWVKDKT